MPRLLYRLLVGTCSDVSVNATSEESNACETLPVADEVDTCVGARRSAS